MERQIRTVGLVMLVLFILLFLQLNNVQVIGASKYADSPKNPRVLLRLYGDPRGAIQTADGVVVAVSVASNDKFKYLRRYPLGPLFAGVTGYFSLVYGTDGTEETYNSYLISHAQPVKHISDIVADRSGPDDVTLTVNSSLQQAAATALGTYTGAVVALDPRTGAILAMYSNPTYDPNALASHDTSSVVTAWKANSPTSPDSPMLARAYRRAYAPGSTFKVITASAALDHAPDLATKVYPTVASIKLPQTTLTLSNFGGETCGGQLPVLLQISCDTGFGQMGLDLGGGNLVAEAQAFGFNAKPPIDLPGAATSTIPAAASFANNQPGVAYSAIGQQNVSATALEMALVTAGIANGGSIMAPHVMSQVRDAQGNLVAEYQPKAWLQATSAATAAAVGSMMVGVVQGGTATNVALPGIQVAAKTGTAQTQSGAGSNNWLEAFAPFDAPTVVVVAVVPAQPGLPTDSTGSVVAGPIVKAVLQAAISTRNLA